MTFFGREALGPTTSHPHESPRLMTVPDDRARGRLGRRRRVPGARRHGSSDWLEPVVGVAEHRARRCPVRVITGRRRWRWSPSASLIAYLQYAPRPVPADARRRRRCAHRRRPQRPLRRRVQRGGLHAARPAPHPRAGRGSTTRASTARSAALAAGDRRAVRPAAPAADRLRPLATPCRCSPAPSLVVAAVLAGEAVTVTDFPWLTVLWPGAARRARSWSRCCPRPRRDLAKQVGARRLAGHAGARRRHGAAVRRRRRPSFQFVESHDVDPGVRRRATPSASTASRWC